MIDTHVLSRGGTASAVRPTCFPISAMAERPITFQQVWQTRSKRLQCESRNNDAFVLGCTHVAYK